MTQASKPGKGLTSSFIFLGLLFPLIYSTLARAQDSNTASAQTPTIQGADSTSALPPAPGEDTPDAQQTPAASSSTPVLDQGFFHRLGRAYVADWAGTAPGPDPSLVSKRRGTPPPIFSPPYPSSDWPIGGTVLIGAPDGQSYPLMQAI